MSPKYIVLLVFIYVNAVKSEGPSWDYEDTDKWGDNYEQCNGKKQSPIDLQRKDAIYAHRNSELKFHYYDVPLEDVILHNNGNGVEAQIPNTVTGERPFISGGPLKSGDIYEAQSFHFHWGKAGAVRRGSEHSLNLIKHALEMQIVYKNPKHDNTFVVLGILLDQQDDVPGNYGLNKVFNKLPDVTTYGSNATIDSTFQLNDLFGGLSAKKYYYYEGTLTTPPCSYAFWFIFDEFIPIPRNQLEKFWQILDKNNNTFTNLRPQFDLGDRRIYKNY